MESFFFFQSYFTFATRLSLTPPSYGRRETGGKWKDLERRRRCRRKLDAKNHSKIRYDNCGIADIRVYDTTLKRGSLQLLAA